MKNNLKYKKIRQTPFREAVLAVFEKHTNAISLNQIELELQQFDRITLYRTLKTFIENGIIHEIIVPGEEKKMALCAKDCEHNGATHQHEHIHFHCKICEEIFCLETSKFPTIQVKNYQIDSLEIIAKGICSACKNKV